MNYRVEIACASLLGMLILTTGACGETDPNRERFVASVTLTLPASPPEVTDTVQLDAQPLDDGQQPYDRPVTWASSNTSIATVSPEGSLVALAPGLVTVTATSDGIDGTGQVTIVDPAVASIDLAAPAGSLVPDQVIQLVATLKDKRGNVLTGRVTAWASSSPAVATVTGTGTVTPLLAGATTITVTSEGKTKSVNLTVLEGGFVGPAGGTISAFNGAFNLVVPAGALANPVPLAVTRRTGLPLDPQLVDASAFVLAPASTQFGSAATLRVAYQPSNGPQGVPETDLGVDQLNGASWQPVAGTVIDPQAHTAEVPVTAGGTYGVRRQPSTVPCTAPEYHQFDFWLGTWDFTGPTSFNGTNIITSEPGGCAIFESFSDVSGSQGRSISVYSTADQMWHQTFVDAFGRTIFTGTLVNGKMVLFTNPTTRFIWDPVSAQVVRFYGESTTDGGVTWNLIFDSQYAH